MFAAEDQAERPKNRCSSLHCACGVQREKAQHVDHRQGWSDNGNWPKQVKSQDPLQRMRVTWVGAQVHSEQASGEAQLPSSVEIDE